jgi:hypothetical protein
MQSPRRAARNWIARAIAAAGKRSRHEPEVKAAAQAIEAAAAEQAVRIEAAVEWAARKAAQFRQEKQRAK